MGFWVTTQNIQRLVAKLDWKFSDDRIKLIRNNANRLARFDPNINRNLRNVARLMRIWPGGPNDSGTTDAMKWYGFLMWLHTQTNAANGGATIIADDLRSLIFNGLNDPSCKSISFLAIEGTDVRLASSQISLAQAPFYVLAVVLQTVAHGNDPKPDPGPTDGADSQDPPGDDLGIVAARKRPRAGKPRTAAKKKVKPRKRAAKKRSARK
jgi:hypothetical protein